MRPPHPLKDIAAQAGLSEATVDRALHGRSNVSAAAVRAVEQAVLELDRQQSQLRLGARTVLVDVGMQAPARFTSAVRTALEAELAWVRPAAVRARCHRRERADVEELVETIDRVGSGGRTSQGLLLKAPDDLAIAAAVDRAAGRGIPVVTLVTDVPSSRRVAYVGLDNQQAGATAAFLVSRWLTPRGVGGGEGRRVLVTMSRSTFLGEHERVRAFEDELAVLRPEEPVLVVSDADGLDAATGDLVGAALDEEPGVCAVYSVGGGNRATLAELRRRGRRVEAYVAHDLDEDNVALLRSGAIDAVIHHDLQSDCRRAVRQVLRHHRLVSGAPLTVPASLEIITRYNLPTRWIDPA